MGKPKDYQILILTFVWVVLCVSLVYISHATQKEEKEPAKELPGDLKGYEFVDEMP